MTLKLNKETIRILSRGDFSAVAGGMQKDSIRGCGGFTEDIGCGNDPDPTVSKGLCAYSKANPGLC